MRHLNQPLNGTCVVYFDQLSGAARTRKLVETSVFFQYTLLSLFIDTTSFTFTHIFIVLVFRFFLTLYLYACMLNRIFNLARLFVLHKLSFEYSSSSNLINTFDDLFRHTFMSPITHMKVPYKCMPQAGFKLGILAWAIKWTMKQPPWPLNHQGLIKESLKNCIMLRFSCFNYAVQFGTWLYHSNFFVFRRH